MGGAFIIIYADSKKEVTRLLNERLKHAVRAGLEDVRFKTKPVMLEMPQKDIKGKIWSAGTYKGILWVHS